VARVESKFARMDPEAFIALAGALGEYPSMVERLGEISCPTTVIVGANDTGLRGSADVLAAGIPGATLVVIADAGHSPQEDQPEAWTAAVQHHLAPL
jgi:2-succinyl-6-hydroxy-2,4-cyclohexadiene-1-carboxylate synthase